jgi:hypothetical protein
MNIFKISGTKKFGKTLNGYMPFKVFWWGYPVSNKLIVIYKIR